MSTDVAYFALTSAPGRSLVDELTLAAGRKQRLRAASRLSAGAAVAEARPASALDASALMAILHPEDGASVVIEAIYRLLIANGSRQTS